MNSRLRYILIAIMLLLALGIGVMKYLQKAPVKSPMDQWSGEWKFFYYYSTDTNLVYTGELQVGLADSSIHMNVLAPKSNRPEEVQVTAWSVSDEGGLSGVIVHDLYRIRGGHPSESFTLQLTDDQSFEGSGSCIEFCAEGTEGIEMIWRGTRESVQ